MIKNIVIIARLFIHLFIYFKTMYVYSIYIYNTKALIIEHKQKKKKIKTVLKLTYLTNTGKE